MTVSLDDNIIMRKVSARLRNVFMISHNFIVSNSALTQNTAKRKLHDINIIVCSFKCFEAKHDSRMK